MERDAVLNIRLPKAVKAALAKVAKREMRTVSSMAGFALAEWLTERGQLPKSPLHDKAPRRATKRR